ncbi:MAG: choice-of-anchor K domain-containing protein [Pseudomonadota bacterium]
MLKADKRTTLIAAGLLAAAPGAHAASVSITILDVAFENPTHVTGNYDEPSLASGTTDTDATAVVWGKGWEGGTPSRYEFDPIDVTATVADNDPFVLGDFYHFNNPIHGDSKILDTVELKVMLGATFQDDNGNSVTTEMTASFLFGHTETMNRPADASHCTTEYVGGDCSDQVTLLSSNLDSYDGVVGDENVNLEILGFGTNLDEVGSYFWTTEGKTTSSPLLAEFRFWSEPQDQEDPNAVPLPAAAWLLIAGIGSLAAARRARKA